MNLYILFGTLFVLMLESRLISATFQLDINGDSEGPIPSSAAAASALNSMPDINVHVGLAGASNTANGGSSSNVVAALLPGQVNLRKGVDCGYVSLNSGDNIQLNSRNYNMSNYFNNEACTWRFEANQCTLSVACPCVDFPASPFCFDDYLRVTDKYNFDQKYCGGNKLVSPLVSSSNSLMVKYRTNGRVTATGFVCFVSCWAPPAINAPPLIEPYKCPNAPATTM